MKSKQGYTLPGIALTEQGHAQTTGDFPGATGVRCLVNGTITVTWLSGATKVITLTAGQERFIECKSIALTQIDEVTVVNAVDANVYAVNVNGTVYSYTAPTTSTLAIIADGLAALIPNSVSDGVSKVTITSASTVKTQSVTIDGTTTVGTDLTVAVTTGTFDIGFD